MSIIKKILLEILALFVSFFVSTLGVVLFCMIFDINIGFSNAGKALIANTIFFIMFSAAQPAIWKKGFITNSDRIAAFLVASIVGTGIYFSLDILASYIIFFSKFTFSGFGLGFLANVIGVFTGSFFCSFHLKRIAKNNENAEKIESDIRSRTVTNKCPSCEYEYTNFDYREDAEIWYCSHCKAKIPKI